jgi:hypothetical protein
MLSGLYTLDSHNWVMLSGLYTLDSHNWVMLSGLYTLDSHNWVMLSGLYTLDSHNWVPDRSDKQNVRSAKFTSRYVFFRFVCLFVCY